MSATIPLFPLGSPLFPAMVQPLHIFEPRYRQLVQDLLHGAERDAAPTFGVVAINAGHEVGVDAATSLAGIGCLADVRAVAALPDGRYDLVAVGFQRFRLICLVEADTPYLQAAVEWLDEVEGPDVVALAEQAATEFRAYRTLLAVDHNDPDDLPQDPTTLSYALGAAIMLPPMDRQAVLASPTTADRLQLLLRLMQRERTMVGSLRAVPATGLLDPRVSPN